MELKFPVGLEKNEVLIERDGIKIEVPWPVQIQILKERNKKAKYDVIRNEKNIYIAEADVEVNKENNRIALAVKDINNDPWQLIAKEVAVGDVITGKVVRTIDRGAFVEIKEGVEAYLPISQLSEKRVPTVSSVVNPGDEIEAKILNFHPEEKRMLISIKEVNAEPEEDYTQFMKPEESLGATIGDAIKKAGK